MQNQWFLVGGLILGLVGCGSSSGKDGMDDADAPNPPASGLSITADNADVATAVAIEAVDVATDAGDGALDLSGGAVGVRVETERRINPGDTAIEFAIKARQHLTSSLGSGAVGVIIEETVDCGVSGSSTFRIDTGPLGQQEFAAALQEGAIPPGISVEMTFDQCLESAEDDLVSGGFQVTFLAFPLDGFAGLGDFVIEIEAVFDDLQSGAERIDGALTAVLTSSSTGEIDIVTSGGALELTADGRMTTLTDFVITVSDDGVELIESTIDFTVDDTELAGQLTVATLMPLITNKLDERPLSGSIKVTGMNSSVTATVLDGSMVQLDVDSDGDGVTNTTMFVTWEELDALMQSA